MYKNVYDAVHKYALKYVHTCAARAVMKWTRPLCGAAAMSHTEFTIREPIEPQEASPMKHEMHVLGNDIAKRVFHAVGMDDRLQRTNLATIEKKHDMECTTRWRSLICKIPLSLLGLSETNTIGC
jgi:hypothetical protein